MLEGVLNYCRMRNARGSSSVGRASPCHGEGRGFESRLPLWPWAGDGHTGGMAEWLGKGLQNPVPRFNSGCRLLVGDGCLSRGRLAQGESASLTRKRSVVRIHYRPLRNSLYLSQILRDRERPRIFSRAFVQQPCSNARRTNYLSASSRAFAAFSCMSGSR